MGIGKNIKALARSRRLSLVELSEKSGVPINTIYTLTREDPRNATMRTLDRLAEALEVDVRTLQTGIIYAPERERQQIPERSDQRRHRTTKERGRVGPFFCDVFLMYTT